MSSRRRREPRRGFEGTDAAPVVLPEDKALPLLQSGEIIGGYRMPWGSNYTFIVHIDAGDEKYLRAIYKPRDGERPLYDFPGGTERGSRHKVSRSCSEHSPSYRPTGGASSQCRCVPRVRKASVVTILQDKGHFGCDLLVCRGSPIISKSRVRFVVATDALSAWWAETVREHPALPVMRRLNFGEPTHG